MEPVVVDQLEVDNALTRALSYLLAYDGAHMRLLGCSTAGALKTVNIGSGLSLVDVDSGTGADAYAAGQTFAKTATQSKVWVIVETYAAIVALFDSTGAAMDEMALPVGVWEFDVASKGGKLKNRTPGQNSVFQFIWLS